jgi:hypothetical protein
MLEAPSLGKMGDRQAYDTDLTDSEWNRSDAETRRNPSQHYGYSSAFVAGGPYKQKLVRELTI